MSSSSTYFYHVIIIRFSLSPRLLACVIPVGQLFGYAIAPLIMTVTTPTQLYILIYTSTTTHTFVQPFYLHQRISKKLQYIGATLFMAVSLGVLSLSYWTQVHVQDLVSAIASSDFNYNFSELWVWTDCSSTSWFGCWQSRTHPWIRHGLVDFIITAHCPMNNSHAKCNMGVSNFLQPAIFVQLARNGLGQLCNAWGAS